MGNRSGVRGGLWFHVAATLTTVLVLGACTGKGPAPSSQSPEQQNARTAELDDFAAYALSQGAQAVVLHVRSGGHETARAVGVSNLDSGTQANVDDKLWVSGAGTAMLSVAVMKLVEERAISLEDRIADRLPEFSSIFSNWDRTTIRELLGSRSGLPDYVPALFASTTAEKLRTSTLTFEDRLRLAASSGAAPTLAFHATWSATDWEVLGWLVERLRGKPLAEVLKADVFDPAGMTTSLVAAPGQPPEPMLHGYVLSGNGRVDLTRDDAFAGSGDAGILSTVADMNKFFAALTTGRLVRPETWKQMSDGQPYKLGIVTEDLCPATRHVLASGGGGPYAILSASTADGKQQVSVAMVLPPSPIDSTAIPSLVQRMGEALRANAAAMCGGPL